MRCGQRLKELRKTAKMTQNEVAKHLGMRQPHYARYEINERDTPIEKIIQLADLYSTSVDYIISRTDVQKPYPPANVLGEEQWKQIND